MNTENLPTDLAAAQPLHLFQAFGVELEYMIVDAPSLAVRPICDELIKLVAGEYVSEVELGEIAWSNELALHVVELKTNGPAAHLARLPDLFQGNVRRISESLEPLGARLMPSAMHPWMDPHQELKLWPHEYNPVYEAYNRIFDCRGHGWANLQSVHLNLPFADDDEFGRLHAAIRLLLPLLPALAASSPVADRQLTGFQDTRLEVYRTNSRRIPSVSGDVIPEPVFTQAAYEEQIFGRMYRDIEALDPEGLLQHEFLNSRGAIARFDRGAIEIRVLDIQECPVADVAICHAVASVLKALVDQRWTTTAEQQQVPTAPLVDVLHRTTRDGQDAPITELELLQQFGLGPCNAGDLWQHLLKEVLPASADGEPGSFWQEPLQLILDHGTLAQRISRALRDDVPSRLPEVYLQLCDCLASGTLFRP